MSLQYFEGAFKYRSAIMGLAMLSIIFFHQNYVHFLPFPVFHRIGYWGVEIFLFLSGMGMVNALQRYTLSHAYKRRFHRILPSCMVIGTGKYLSFLLIGAPLALTGEKLHMGWWSVFSFDLWFIYAILAYYILTPILFIAIVNHPKISLLTILGIHMVTVFLWKEQIGHDWFNPLGVFVWIIDRLPVFSIGMYLTVYQEKVDKKTLVISLLFLLISMLLFTPCHQTAHHPLHQPIPHYSHTINGMALHHSAPQNIYSPCEAHLLHWHIHLGNLSHS